MSRSIVIAGSVAPKACRERAPDIQMRDWLGDATERAEAVP